MSIPQAASLQRIGARAYELKSHSALKVLAMNIKTLKKYRLWFALIFLLSTALLIAAPELILRFGLYNQYAPPGPDQTAVARLDTSDILVFTSLITSLVSLVGLLLSTWAAWRKERRDKDFSDLELEKKKLELEAIRHDLKQKIGKED